MSAEVITFRVPCVPVGQPRPRARAFNGRAQMYEQRQIVNKNTGERKAHPIVAFKATTRHIASSIYHGAPLTGPLRIDVQFVFPRTSSQVWKKRAMPRLRHIKKPDRDNCEKALLDALTGIIFADDCQVCAGEVTKWIASGDEQPHVLVSVTILENDQP